MSRLISFCIPIMDRLDDLKQTMPYLLAAAEESPPVEIAILDYSSTDGLREWLPEHEAISYKRYDKAQYYHMAHARNLSVLASHGEIVVIFSSDLIPQRGFVTEIRRLFAAGNGWAHDGIGYPGVIACDREDFIAIRGFDERFEFYGPEDKDFRLRLERLGLPHAEYPEYLLGMVRTFAAKKVAKYRIHSLDEMKAQMRPIFEETKASERIVANGDVNWGQW